MKKSLPPLTWFRAFEAAARHLSFTLAADELGFTQSAISQHVRALEDRLGSPLFIRGNRALILTDAGRALLPDVATAMATLTSATERFLPQGNRRTLTIATSASVAHWVIAPHMASFHAEHPAIALNLVTTVWPDDFVATNADIEIRFGAPSIAGKDARRLEPNALHLVAHPDLATDMPAPALRDWLPKQMLIQPVGLSITWAEIGRRLGASAPLAPSLTVDTHGMAVELAVGGGGVALCHKLISRTALRSGKLMALTCDTLDAKEGYFLAANTTTQTDAQAAFLTWFDALITI